MMPNENDIKCATAYRSIHEDADAGRQNTGNKSLGRQHEQARLDWYQCSRVAYAVSPEINEAIHFRVCFFNVKNREEISP